MNQRNFHLPLRAKTPDSQYRAPWFNPWSEADPTAVTKRSHVLWLRPSTIRYLKTQESTWSCCCVEGRQGRCSHQTQCIPSPWTGSPRKELRTDNQPGPLWSPTWRQPLQPPWWCFWETLRYCPDSWVRGLREWLPWTQNSTSFYSH